MFCQPQLDRIPIKFTKYFEVHTGNISDPGISVRFSSLDNRDCPSGLRDVGDLGDMKYYNIVILCIPAGSLLSTRRSTSICLD